jgi:hypothetical protein
MMDFPVFYSVHFMSTFGSVHTLFCFPEKHIRFFFNENNKDEDNDFKFELPWADLTLNSMHLQPELYPYKSFYP